jgi:hypothetical protein
MYVAETLVSRPTLVGEAVGFCFGRCVNTIWNQRKIDDLGILFCSSFERRMEIWR